MVIQECILRFEDSFESQAREHKKIKKLTRSDAIRCHNERYMVADRFKNGFRLQTWKEIGGRWRMPFGEQGFRTEDNPILQLFIRRVPRAGKVRTSSDKANLSSQYYSKTLSLDEPYIEANKTIVGMIRIDIEATYKSAQHCLAHLENMVEEGAIPHVPHIIVGDTLRDGTFARPHFIVMLPKGSEVWWNFEDMRCRKKPVLLLDSVIRGWYNAFIGHGVDVAAPRLTQRMKNPISPFWTTLTPKIATFMTLQEYSEHLDTTQSIESLKRRANAIQSEMNIEASNPLWNKLTDRAKEFTRTMFLENRKEMDRLLINRDKFYNVMVNDLNYYAEKNYLNVFHKKNGRKSILKPASLLRTCRNIAKYYAYEFAPSRLERNVNRHKLLHLVDGVQGVKERQRVASAYTNEEKKKSFEKAIKEFAKAYEAAVSSGNKFSVETVALKSGLSKAAAYKYIKQLKTDAKESATRPSNSRPQETPEQAYFVSAALPDTDDDYSEPVQPDTYDEYDVEWAENIYISSSYQQSEACNMLADHSELTYR